MSKESTLCQRIISLSEQIILHREINKRQKQVQFLYSRLKSPPPSSIFIKEIIEESERTISELKQDVQKLMLPLLKGIKFDITEYIFSKRDLYRGYIELYDSSEKEYILFLKPFNNGALNIEEGELKLNDAHQVSRIISELKPIKKSPEIKTLFDVLMNQK